MSERDLDVVVFGATGVTGRQVAAYLAQRSAAAGMRCAAAARAPAKLAQTLSEVGAAELTTVRADLEDPASLAEMAARARVVLNLVGPYTRYGWPVVEACVAGGAHYFDLTGEIPFVRRVIDAFHEPAAAAGVKVVQVSGFEALPADLAVLRAAELARERWDEALAEVDVEVTFQQPPGMPRGSDVLSGGTIQSMLAIAGEEPDASRVTDPAALIPDPDFAASVRRRSPILIAPRLGRDRAVIAPMAPAAFINPAVIHRTAWLTSGGAAPFRYREGLALAGGAATLPVRYAAASALSGTQALLRRLLGAPLATRSRIARALARVAPGSGFGPSADRLDGWSWGMSVRAVTAGGHTVSVEVQGDGHPGYLTTAKMLGEAGILTAASSGGSEQGGCLTPAVALGTGALDAFEHAGLRFR